MSFHLRAAAVAAMARGGTISPPIFTTLASLSLVSQDSTTATYAVTYGEASRGSVTHALTLGAADVSGDVVGGEIVVTRTDSARTLTVTSTATWSGPPVVSTDSVTVAALGYQVLLPAGGLRQAITPPSSGTLDTTGIWLMAWAYDPGGDDWTTQAILAIGDEGVSSKQLVLLTNTARYVNTSYRGPAALSAPGEGWHLCTARTAKQTTNVNVYFWRDGEVASATNQSNSLDLSLFDTVQIGFCPGLTSLAVPARAFAWGYGDPSEAHAWIYNSGSGRDIIDYDFAADSNCTLEGYWNGVRETSGTPFNASTDLPDLVGALDAWTVQSGDGATWTAMPAMSSPPAQMSAPTVTPIGSDAVLVQHATIVGEVTRVDGRYSTDDGGTWSAAEEGIGPEWGIDGLDPETEVLVQTRAVNDHGAGAWSPQGSATTEAEAPAPAAPQQALLFAGGLKQTVSPFGGGAVDTAGIWMSAWAYYDGTTWATQALMALADAGVNNKQLVLLTNRSIFWSTSGIGPTAADTPAEPGWYLCTGRFTYPGTPAARFWRGGDVASAAATYVFSGDISDWTTLIVGYRPNGPSTLTVPACGFAWGYGDPAAAHAWTWNDGDHREMSDYDFGSDADCSLQGYWRGARAVDETSFDPATELGDEIGALDAWTAEGDGAEWSEIAPPWQGGLALLAAAETTGASEITLTVTRSGGWDDDPEFDADLAEIWSSHGFGPLSVESYTSSEDGATGTIVLAMNREIYASEPLHFKGVAGWVTTPGGVNSALAEAEILNNEETGDPTDAPGVSMDRIAFELNPPVPYRFIGDHQIVELIGATTITHVWPAQTTIGGAIVNGAHKNPYYSSRGQTYDQRTETAYYLTPTSMPCALEPGDSLVLSRVNPSPYTTMGGTAGLKPHGVHVEQYLGINCLASMPESSRLPGPVVRDGSTSVPAGLDLDEAAIAATLPEYSPSGLNLAPIALVHKRLRQFAPVLAQNGHVELRRRLWPGHGAAADGYSEFWCAAPIEAMKYLTLDISAEDKQMLIRDIAVLGSQAHWARRNTDLSLHGDGAQNMGYGFVDALYDIWCNGGAGLSHLVTKGGSEFSQMKYLTGPEATSINEPHDPDTNKPRFSQWKTVTAVSGDDLTMEEDAAGYGQFYGPYGYELWLGDDSKHFLITNDTTNTFLGDPSAVKKFARTRRLTVPGHTFSVGNRVYAKPLWAATHLQEGDIAWVLQGSKLNYQYSGGVPPAYYTQMKWGCGTAAMHAMGYIAPPLMQSWDFFQKSLLSDYPHANHDWGICYSTAGVQVGAWEPGGPTAYISDAAYLAAHLSTIAEVTQDQWDAFA